MLRYLSWQIFYYYCVGYLTTNERKHKQKKKKLNKIGYSIYPKHKYKKNILILKISASFFHDVHVYS